ncbi:MAG: triple tyrosine motif-containing protein, partial [Bacteroidota bacterium]
MLESFPDRSAQCFRDNRGELWGFFEAGFGLLKDGFQRTSLYSYDSIRSSAYEQFGFVGVVQGLNEHLWIIAENRGLANYDLASGAARWFSVEDGLPHKNLNSIVMDHDGILWIATMNGLSRFDPATSTFRNYSTADGLPTTTFYSGHGVLTRTGEILFGTTDGYVAFNPADLAPDPTPPTVVLTGFSVLHKTLPFTQDFSELHEIEITFRENVFSFEVAALDLTRPEANLFAYRMDGFDKDWIQAGTRRYFTYTNLNPGTYTFRAKGANSDGVWNERGIAVQLTITPPFWFRWWFLTATGLFLVSLVVYLHRWRLEKPREIKQTRDQIPRDLHHDVASTRGSIPLYTAALK